MRKPATLLLLAAMLPAFAFAAPAAAQGVYIDTGPAAFGFGVGPVYSREVEVIDDDYDDADYDSVRVYTYERRVYRHRDRDDGDRRVYYYASPPYGARETVIVRPRTCGYNRYWRDGACVNVHGKGER
jgi:hypothetical protein